MSLRDKKPTATDRIIAIRLRKLREARHIPGRKVAEWLGISAQQYAKYEAAQNRISAGALWEISVAFGVPMQVFFPGIRPLPDAESVQGFSRLRERERKAVQALVKVLARRSTRILYGSTKQKRGQKTARL